MTLYVNNLLHFASEKAHLIKIQVQLSGRFKMIDLREISHYLDMEVDFEIEKKISLPQTTYPTKILKRFQMSNCKLVFIPINHGVANSLFPSKIQTSKVTIKWYQSAISSLIWPSVYIWPDISY